MKFKLIIKGKKGAISSILSDFWAYVAFVFVVLLFWTLFTLQGNDINKIEGLGNEATKIDVILLNFLRTPVEIQIDSEQQQFTIADIISMVDVEEGKEERIEVFQETAENIFETQYPYRDIDEWEGAVPWWLRVYDADEIPRTGRSGKYFKVFRIPGEGYIYGPGVNCEPGRHVVSTVIIPKADKGHVKLVFCIFESYLEKTK